MKNNKKIVILLLIFTALVTVTVFSKVVNKESKKELVADINKTVTTDERLSISKGLKEKELDRNVSTAEGIKENTSNINEKDTSSNGASEIYENNHLEKNKDISKDEKYINSSSYEGVSKEDNSEKYKDTCKAHDKSSEETTSKGIYTVEKEYSFPGAFTYDVKLVGKDGENFTGFQLLYEDKVIAEDVDKDGVVKPLHIFLGISSDKSKLKVMKDGQEIKVNGLN